jgi:hypothetical protein
MAPANAPQPIVYSLRGVLKASFSQSAGMIWPRPLGGSWALPQRSRKRKFEQSWVFRDEDARGERSVENHVVSEVCIENEALVVAPQ